MRFSLHKLAAALLACLAAPAAAEPAEAFWEVCADEGATPYPADERVAACTALIASPDQNSEDLARAYGNRASAHYERRDFVLVLGDLDRAIQLNPGDAQAHFGRGFVYSAQGDQARAIANYDEAIRLEPQNAVFHNGRGNANLALGDFARATADYEKAIRLDPRYARPRYNRGLTYTRQGDYVRAIADYDEAIRLNPQFVEAYNNRCMMRAMYLTGELDLARADCDAAIRLAGDEPLFRLSRGFVGLRQGRFRDAWDDYDAAVRATPDDSGAVYGRGTAALRLGRTAEGQADIARATALDANIAQRFAADFVAP
jgi:tetratricopeptide (TPR) repeat protein